MKLSKEEMLIAKVKTLESNEAELIKIVSYYKNREAKLIEQTKLHINKLDINQIMELASYKIINSNCPRELSSEQFRILCITLASADYLQSIGSPISVAYSEQSRYTGSVDE